MATEPPPQASSGSENVIVVRGLTKVFKDFWNRPQSYAVNNVDFDVRRGEVFGLLGPNGSGKTTTIKLLLGLLYPTRGHLELFGRSPRHVATKERIGYLPEESYLYRYLNARETLSFFGNLFRLNRIERRKRSEQLLEMVGLKNVVNRPVGEYSKGMQRRIGLAQALINDPDLIILDEPTAGLDPIGCREIKDLILALARRGKTVVLSSHLLADVEDVCDRVLIYYGGRRQAQGSLKELLAETQRTRIVSPALSDAAKTKVRELLKSEVGEAEVRIDNPTQNLENYFLNVVEQARKANQATSGALAGNQVAAYLRGEAEEDASPDRKLERLTRPQAPSEPPDEPTTTPAPPVDERTLERLTQTETIESAPVPAPEPEDPEESERLLSSLVSKKK